MTTQEINYGEIASNVYDLILQRDNLGKVPTYIPELAKVPSDKFGVYFRDFNGNCVGKGNYDEKFSIQSISKILALVLAYREIGDKLWSRVGIESSGNAFNSLLQLEKDNGIPRNPLINGGAIVVCDVLLSLLKDPKTDFISFVRGLSDQNDIDYCQKVAESEKSVGYRNFALCYYIKSLGNLANDPLEVLDLYFHLCSIEMTCKEMAHTFTFLANDGCRLCDGKRIISSTHTKRINAIMQTCGFYDESGEFAFRVGLPGKSGVGGGIFAVNPSRYCIAVWSPRLNEKGNSYRGMQFLESFTIMSKSSIF